MELKKILALFDNQTRRLARSAYPRFPGAQAMWAAGWMRGQGKPSPWQGYWDCEAYRCGFAAGERLAPMDANGSGND